MTVKDSGKPNESPLGKLAVSGLVAWVFEFSGGHFLEFLKIAKQTSDLSYGEITRRMVKTKGIVGVLDGFFPWGSVQALAKGATFGFGHAMGHNLLHGRLPDFWAEVGAGGIGGGVQGFILSPLLLLKTRVMTDPSFRNSGGMWATTVASTRVGLSVIRNEGPTALMKGSVVFSSKRVLDWTTRFFFAELVTQGLKDYKKTNKLSSAESMSCALIGGALSATATIPMDVVVAAIQDASKAGQKVSVIDLWKEKMRQQGLTGLVQYSSKGFIARVTHVSLTTLLMKEVSSVVYTFLDKFQR